MALMSDLYDEFDMKRIFIKDKNGNLRSETDDELEKRLKKEEKDEYEKNIKSIMKNGFTRKQANYLYGMENRINKAARTYVPPPRF